MRGLFFRAHNWYALLGAAVRIVRLTCELYQLLCPSSVFLFVFCGPIESLNRLVSNLRTIDIPLALVSQFMPERYKKIRVGALAKDPEALKQDRMMDNMREYAWATGVRRTIIDWWLRRST